MAWWEQLGKDNRGSRPRCVLLVDGNREEVADRLTRLVGLPDVVVSSGDKWIPYGKPVRRNGVWDKSPANEAELDKADNLLPGRIRQELQDWWIAVRGRGRGARTPNWDLVSTCRIKGKSGFLLIEAKAHENEMSESDASGSTNPQNRERIGRAINQARTELRAVTGGNWDISRDHHYQLSNRFAWSWKLVSLGYPVVLLYLGFLKAQDMAKDMSRNDSLFESESDWERTLKGHCHGIVPETCWDQRWDFGGVPFYPIIRAFHQPFSPN